MRTVSAGLSNKAIAQKLWVTEQTVKFHLTNIYRKIGVTNRTEAARWALGKGLQIDAQELKDVGLTAPRRSARMGGDPRGAAFVSDARPHATRPATISAPSCRAGSKMADTMSAATAH